MTNDEIKVIIYRLDTKITVCESALNKLKFDELSSNEIQRKIEDCKYLRSLLTKELPLRKTHDFGGEYRCRRCGCVVNKYAKYCHYCGQRLSIGNTSDEDIGWCPDK